MSTPGFDRYLPVRVRRRPHRRVSTCSSTRPVAGVKCTTCPVMAADAVDEVARGLDGRVPPSCTRRAPLLGAEGCDAAWNARYRTATRYGIHVA